MAFAAACGGGGGSSSQAPASIKVGAVIPLTGRYAALGAQIKGGYEIAIDEINASGGAQVKQFNKRIPLELQILDDSSDPTQTVQRLETLESSGVLAYLGGVGSDLHIA